MSATLSAITNNYSANQQPKLDYLRELAGGDLNFIAEILEMFIDEAPQAIKQSLEHLDKKNYELLRITVHKLKSSVQVVGGNHLTALICEIEAAAKNSKPEMLPQMLALLNEGIGYMVKHLTGELRGIKP
jgi:HPt (histidine-containing phosphotransfer) domain-containing protein